MGVLFPEAGGRWVFIIGRCFVPKVSFLLLTKLLYSAWLSPFLRKETGHEGQLITCLFPLSVKHQRPKTQACFDFPLEGRIRNVELLRVKGGVGRVSESSCHITVDPEADGSPV